MQEKFWNLRKQFFLNNIFCERQNQSHMGLYTNSNRNFEKNYSMYQEEHKDRRDQRIVNIYYNTIYLLSIIVTKNMEVDYMRYIMYQLWSSNMYLRQKVDATLRIFPHKE